MTTSQLRNSIHGSLQRCGLLLVSLLLGCFVFPQRTQAVVPPPDGGYPGFNTAEGQNALFNLTTGSANTAVGWQSLSSNTEGSFNTAIGAGTLLANTGDNNTATGVVALLSNTTGISNTATGDRALFGNTSGNFNTATGDRALLSNTTGSANTANGLQALKSNTTGGYNTAIGPDAMGSNTAGHDNTAIGDLALYYNTTGSSNTAIGDDAGTGVTTANHVICIGTDGANISNSCFIGNIRGHTTANTNAIPILIDSAGQLGTVSSSKRFKKEIKPMDKGSEAILGLKPVTFEYKSDKTDTPQFGLIAEEVADVNPDLVVRDEKGEIYTVRYDAVNAMLLNEFLKEHRKVEVLEKGMEVLTTQLKEQAVQIQKVSAQLEVSRPAPQTVLNNQ